MKHLVRLIGAALVMSVPMPAPAGSEGPVASGFIGVWKLVATEQRLADGTIRPAPAFGPNGLGYLIYAKTHMCALLVDPNRPRWDPAQTPSEQQVRAAFNGAGAYCGIYEVDEKDRLVIHHAELDTTPSDMGTLRKRHFVFSGDRLVLHPVPPLPEGVVEYSLTWERVEK